MTWVVLATRMDLNNPLRLKRNRINKTTNSK